MVISVVALLIAILLPALASARESGRNSQCSNNERQLAIACWSYASDQMDWLPYYPLVAADGGNMARSGWFLTNGSGASPPRGMGLLYSQGYVGAPQGFYCPLMHELFRWDWTYNNTGADPWLGVPSPPSAQAVSQGRDVGRSRPYYSSYHYNPHTVASSPGDSGTGYIHEFPRSSLLASNKILLVDVMYMPNVEHPFTSGANAWKRSGHRGLQPYWNCAFGDGHVAVRTSGQLIREMLGGSSGQPSTEGGFGRLNRHLGYLEDQVP